MNKMHVRCPLTFTLSRFNGQWKPLILWAVKDNPLRFGELRRIVQDASLKMLTKHLKELEAEGMLTRTIFPEIPPRVEYQLTELGKSLMPVLEAMLKWGIEHYPRDCKEASSPSKSKSRGRWQRR